MFLKKLLINFSITLFYLNLTSCHRGQRNQPGFIGGFQQNFCRTPLDDIGTCVSLKYCPEVLDLFTKLPQNSAKQYSMTLQRICGNRITYDQYPVLCCTHVRKIDDTTATTTSTSTTTTTTSTEGPSKTIKDRNSNVEDTSCLTQDLKTGICRPLPACSILYDRLLKDPNDENTKTDLRTAHSKCGNVGTVVCCPQTEPEKPATLNNIMLPTEEDGCGQVNVTLTKIVGGEESQIGAWPWMALIGYDPYSTQPFRCGGSLVTARHVLTAAHCIRKDLSFVRLGEFDLSIESETRYVDINVLKHAKHPLYGKNRRSDLAILLLDRSVQFNEFISPICMPYSVQLRSRSYINSMPYVAGWGRTMAGGSGSNVLKQAQLPIQTNDVCRNIYTKQYPSLSAEEFDDSIYCVGFTVGGTDTCQGDSGGPLMIAELYKRITRYYLIGVVSYGIGCGNVPGIYINVQKKMDWILEQIKDM
ncbi:venom serine protease Bi-VSP-like [Cochliomyia hominivorax]